MASGDNHDFTIFQAAAKIMIDSQDHQPFTILS